VEECILLGFVETVDFVDKKDRAPPESPAIVIGAQQNITNIFDTRGNGIELEELCFSMVSNDTGERGLPASRWTPENHGGKLIALDQHTEWFAFTEKMLLPNEINKCKGSDTFRKRGI
jgi:hypothetical protein